MSEESRSEHESRPVVRSTLLVGGLTLLSRITGLVRVAVLARFLGTGIAADAFRIAFLIPSMLRRLVGEGAVPGLFVAVYSQRVEDDPAEATVFTEKFLTLWFFLAASITIAGVVLVAPVCLLIQPLLGDGALGKPENLALTIDVTRIVFWYLFFVGSLAAIQGVLNARWKFGAAASMSAVFNLVFVAATYILAPRFPPGEAVFGISFAVLIGGAVQLFILAGVLRGQGVRFRIVNPFDHEGVRTVLRLMVPGTLGAGVYQINVAVNTIIAAGLKDPGAVSSLGYSNLFMEFVLGVFVIALSTVSLTPLSRLAAAGDLVGFAARATEMVRLVLFITIPSTVGLYLVQEPMVRLVLEGGEFQRDSLLKTLAAFRFHLLGLAFVGVGRVLVASFHAQRDLKAPLLVSLWVLPVNLGLAYVLSQGPLRHGGIALAATIASVVQSLGLLIVLSRRLPHLRLRSLGPFLLKTGVCATIMGAACQALTALLPPPAGKLGAALWLSAVVSAGGCTFFLLAALFRIRESRTLLGSVTGGPGRCR